MKNKIVYIIPTYNEKENILPMLELLDKILTGLKKYKFQILVVDDNSPDGTGEIVTKFAKKHKETILLSGKKMGLGAAMIRGIKYSIKKLNADIVISNEADFSYSPKKVPLMIKKLESGFDVIAGSRRISDLKNWSVGRRVIHFIANSFFAGLVAGVSEVKDHNSAFKAVRVKGVLEKINFTDFPHGFAFFNYFLYRLSVLTPRIYEFETEFKPRTKGESKISFNSKYINRFAKDIIEYSKNCLRIRLEKLGYDTQKKTLF